MGYQVKAMFNIRLHDKDYDLLCKIKYYFGVGSITKHECTTLQYAVKYLQNLSIIIFNYPLISKNRAYYELGGFIA
jgi:LAGLIDADG endonuclease